MKEEKQKRYLCDIDNLKGVTSALFWLGFITVSIALMTLFTYLNYNYNPEITNSDWKSSYENQKEQYTYLYDIFEDVVHEGEVPDITAIPDGVFYHLSLTNDSNTFYYSLDTKIRSDSKYNMKFTFSKDMKILDKECSVTLVSEDEYRQRFNLSLKGLSFLYSIFHYLIILVFFFLCYLISCIHRYIDNKKKLNKLDS